VALTWMDGWADNRLDPIQTAVKETSMTEHEQEEPQETSDEDEETTKDENEEENGDVLSDY
jgi:hypothetical protein